ncbi:MAG: ChaN family lipoprotein, partial [Desulforhopalus sp.]
NPLNSNFVAVLVSSSSAEQTKRVAQRLTHFGKYSYLEFADGRNLAKKITPSEDGIHSVLERLPTGGKTSTLLPFRQMVAQLDDARVVYVGENHTSLSDHLLQLRIIESLYQKDPKLVIGMEMFPASSQQALDDYMVGNIDMDERSFLRNSDYYNVWRFDFRLYRDIISFAKRRRIPVIGLNLDRQIVAEVFRSGGTDSLEEGVKRSLPLDRNLDMAGYTERLSLMHTMHQQGAHGSGEESGFIQAQGLWDETMAENIATILKRLPNHKVIVLAGAQHTRKDSGIPPRVARRVAVPQASVLNITHDSTFGDLDKVADFFFFSDEAALPELPKIGVVLNTETAKGSDLLEITELSPHSKASEAGLRVGDKLTKVNGFAVKSMADLRIAMLDTKPGDKIEVAVIREEKGRKEEMVLNVELTASPVGPVHP